MVFSYLTRVILSAFTTSPEVFTFFTDICFKWLIKKRQAMLEICTFTIIYIIFSPLNSNRKDDYAQPSTREVEEAAFCSNHIINVPIVTHPIGNASKFIGIENEG